MSGDGPRASELNRSQARRISLPPEAPGPGMAVTTDAPVPREVLEEIVSGDGFEAGRRFQLGQEAFHKTRARFRIGILRRRNTDSAHPKMVRTKTRRLPAEADEARDEERGPREKHD